MTNASPERCSYCGTEIPPDALECPICKKTLLPEPDSAPAASASPVSPKSPVAARPSGLGKAVRLPAFIGAGLLVIAFVGGIALDKSWRAPVEAPVSTPEVFALQATPEPPPTPAPTPTVNAIRLYAFGREIGADGFTAYVGDKPFTLTVELEPAVRHPELSWSILDGKGSSDSAILSPGSDGLSCEFSALNPSGKNELTIRCYGAETVIPVYLWAR